MPRRLTRFQALALATTGTTYFLILVGGLVRASGAGLGCPDWPRCFGSWIPPMSAADVPPPFAASQFNPTLMWTEYLNRLLGVAVGMLILAALVEAWRRHRDTPGIFRPTLAAFVLVLFQGWLGGLVVQQALAAWLVTVHMLVALVIVSLLLYATLYAFFGVTRERRQDARPRTLLQISVLALILITLAQVVLGTQVRELVDVALEHGAARGDALAFAGRVDTWHREAAIAIVAATAWTLWILWSRHRRDRTLVAAGAVAAALVAVQAIVGATLAYYALPPAAQVAHLTAASLLVGAQTVLFLLARWLPAEAGVAPSRV